MPLVINTNTLSMNAQRSLTNNTNALAKSIERLASGFRINRAADDAAGLQVSENLRAQIRGSKKALDNTQDGINVLNIADGTLQAIENNLQRMRELTIQGANDTYDAQQRTALQQEYDQLAADITRMFAAVEFNGVQLYAGGGPAAFNLQVGPNQAAATNVIDLIANGVPFFGGQSAADMGGGGGGIDVRTLTGGNGAATDWTTSAEVSAFIGVIDTAIDSINVQRGALGAVVNRLENVAQNLMINIENLSSSESRIRNLDVAAESANLVQNQILQQSAAQVLSQANQTPALALQLLQ